VCECVSVRSATSSVGKVGGSGALAVRPKNNDEQHDDCV